MRVGGYPRSNVIVLTLTALVLMEVCGVQGCWVGSGSECEKAPFVPGHNLAGEGFDVVRMRRTGAYVINVKAHLADNHTCTLCPNRFQAGQASTMKLTLLTLSIIVSSNNLNSLHFFWTVFCCIFPPFLCIPHISNSILPPPESHSTSCLYLFSSDSKAPSCSAGLATFQPLQ